MANPYYNFTDSFVANTKVRSDDMNQELDGITAGFDLLPGVGDAVTRGVTYLGIESGSGNTYTVTMPDTRTAYAEGDRVAFRATHNNTGSAVINIDTIGAVTAVRTDDTALESGDILQDVYYEFIYDSVSSHFQMLNMPGSWMNDMDNRVDWAEEWAINPEDSLVSTSAGGNGVSDYSALHHATKAAASDASAAATYDLFDDRYLGAFAADPTLDNDGDALLTGAQYFNTGSNQNRIYNGASWQNTGGMNALVDDTNPYLGGHLFTNGFELNLTGDVNGNFVFTGQPTVKATGGSFIVAQAIDVAHDAAFQGHLTKDSSGNSVGFFGSIPGDANSQMAAYTWDTGAGPAAWNRVFGATEDALVLQLTNTDITYDGASLMRNLVEDLSPQAGASIDMNGKYIKFDDNTGINDHLNNEQLIFQEVTTPTNFFEMTQAATTNPPILGVAGDDTNIDMNLVPKGTGIVLVHELQVGQWSGNSDYSGLYHADGDANNYLLLSQGTSTFISGAISTSNIHLRPGANSSAMALSVNIDGTLQHKAELYDVFTAEDQVRENMFHNTQFKLWQRHGGNSKTSWTHGEWIADLWQALEVGACVLDSQYTSSNPVISGSGALYTKTRTSDGTLNSTDHVGVQYRIEGNEYSKCHLQECTLSYWIYTNVAGYYSVSITMQGAPPAYSYVHEVNVPALTWTKVEFQFTPGGTGTWYQGENSEGMRVRWTWRAGSTLRTSNKDTWTSGNYYAGNNQTHTWGSSTSHYVYLASPKLEVGSYATLCRNESMAETLAYAQRFYEKSYDPLTAPGNTTTAGNDFLYLTGIASAAHASGVFTKYKVSKYRSPDVTVWASGTGTSGKVRDNQPTTADLTATVDNINKQGHRVYCAQVASKTTVNNTWHWAAEAGIV